MADCSKTLEYVKELNRMCKYYLNTDSKCDKCPLKKGIDCIELTKSQCDNLATFIDLYLLQEIRDNKDLDNLDYVRDMLDAQKILRGKYE